MVPFSRESAYRFKKRTSIGIIASRWMMPLAWESWAVTIQRKPVSGNDTGFMRGLGDIFRVHNKLAHNASHKNIPGLQQMWVYVYGIKDKQMTKPVWQHTHVDALGFIYSGLVAGRTTNLSMTSTMAGYEAFLANNVSTISSIESTLRSLTWFLPGRFKDAELASEACE